MTAKRNIEDILNDWAQTQPHSFFSHWPTASMTKCDWCGVYYKDHPADVADEVDVAKHPVRAIPATEQDVPA